MEKDLIEKYVSLCEYGQKNGILGLEDKIEEIGTDFEKLGLELIVYGTDPNDVDEILTKIINASLGDIDVIKYSIMRDGILETYKGTNPKNMRLKLYAYYGMEGIKVANSFD